MLESYYTVTTWVSIVLMLVFILGYIRHIDVHITLVFVLVPIHNLAQLLLCRSESLEAALIANRILYISACYLILMITLAIFSLCKIELGRMVKTILYLITTIVFIFSQQMGQNNLYYRNVSIVRENGVTRLVKEYGPLHKFYYIMIILYILLGIGAVIYAMCKRHQVSNRFIALLAMPELFSVISFFAGRAIVHGNSEFFSAELLPLSYDLALVVYLIIAHKLVLYNLPDTVIDTIVREGGTGLISFDFRYRYLGSNENANAIIPELKELIVDRPVKNEKIKNTVLKWIKDYSRNNARDMFHYKAGGKSYLVDLSVMMDGKMKRGYQIALTDDTKSQQYIALLGNYNSELKKEVAEKTEHILAMNEKLIISMAAMVESRDNSTGEHIRRTSECVRILMEELKKSSDIELDEQFCNDIVKAAPMHDLGKIAVDDAILRKPGRFTADEFAIMKTHAAEGAKIVHKILKNTDDESFRKLAENVAHYHHERWDGSGYPEGLAGEQIPLEARIMAIADVYDALVSKRVYKESMSFEKADKIILEGMGSQFDKSLEPYYIAARPQLEEYYRSLEAECENEAAG